MNNETTRRPLIAAGTALGIAARREQPPGSPGRLTISGRLSACSHRSISHTTLAQRFVQNLEGCTSGFQPRIVSK
jgi:hypothetical protein